jgi:hypothetical protein
MFRNYGRGIQNSGSMFRNSGTGIQNYGSMFHNFGRGTKNSGSMVCNYKRALIITEVLFVITNGLLKLRRPCSEISAFIDRTI